MIYQSVDNIMDTYHCYDALLAVRLIWYKLSEGLVQVPKISDHYVSFIQYFEGELPDGWSLSIDEMGNIQATTKSYEYSPLMIYKNYFGKEFIQVSPLNP